MSQQTRIVVLGGGYAGLMAAERLAKNTDPNTAITLINDRDMFLERVRNHQRLAGEPVRSLPLSSFLAGTRIRLLVGVVSRLAPARRQLTLETANGSMTIDYDHLVYALGSAVATSDVPGVREHASTLDYAPTLSLARRLPALAALGGRLLVVGGGNTGVEVSTELAEAYPTLKITLVTRRSFARQLSNGARAHVRRAFDRFGISFVENTAITEVREGCAVTARGDAIPFDVCVWVGGFGVSDLARRAGLEVNARGQILVDRALRSVSHPEIYAVGDAASPLDEPGAPVRMGAGTAVMMGAHGADALAAELAGRAPTPFGMSYIALGISLGHRDGVVQFLGASTDRPLSLILKGRLAGASREFFVRLIVWAIRGQRLARWTFYWPGKNKMRHAVLRTPDPAARAAARAQVPVER